MLFWRNLQVPRSGTQLEIPFKVVKFGLEDSSEERLLGTWNLMALTTVM